MIVELEEQLKGIEEEIKQVTEQLSDYRQHWQNLEQKISENNCCFGKKSGKISQD